MKEECGFVYSEFMRVLLFHLLFLTSIPAFSKQWDCTKGAYSILRDGVRTETSTQLCFDSTRNLFASSNCKDEAKCVLFKKLRSHSFLNYEFMSPDSNPGFKLCKEIGLTPLIVRYHFRGQEYRSSLCGPENRESFVNVDFLVLKYREFHAF